MKTLSAVIVAAGNSTRMGVNKQQILLQGKPVWMHSVLTFLEMRETAQIVVVTREADIPLMKQQLIETAPCAAVKFAVGGATRTDSVAAGVAALEQETDHIAIHDGARPLVKKEDILKALAALEQHDAVTLGVPVKDTIKQVDQTGKVIATPDRASLMITQTPQIFKRAVYLAALEDAKQTGYTPTDDCQLVERIGVPVYMVVGSYENIKITTPEDVPMAEAMLKPMKQQEYKMPDLRVGHGYDVHRFAPDRKLILGGVTVPYELGLLGHSDADVLVHAVMDALLGAAALGDIGKHFPDTDAAYKGADSMQLFAHVVKLLGEKGHTVSNIDATVIAQKPKLAPFIPQMKENIAAVCGISPERVNVKATTEEKLGFTGRLEGISAHAVCMLIG